MGLRQIKFGIRGLYKAPLFFGVLNLTGWRRPSSAVSLTCEDLRGYGHPLLSHQWSWPASDQRQLLSVTTIAPLCIA